MRVDRVNLDVGAQQVDLWVCHGSGIRWACPECGAKCGVYDHSEERSWRHLDTCQFKTLIHARIPRVNCAKCGVRQGKTSWAEARSRFTLLMEKLVIEVLEHTRSVKATCELLGIHWESCMRVMRRAVERGQQRKEESVVDYLALDKVRRQEAERLRRRGDPRLKDTRHLWLYGYENVPEPKAESFEDLRESELKTARAWHIKETLRHLWEHPGRCQNSRAFNADRRGPTIGRALCTLPRWLRRDGQEGGAGHVLRRCVWLSAEEISMQARSSRRFTQCFRSAASVGFALWILLLAAAVTGQAATAEDSTSENNSWRINFVPYYWGPDIDMQLELSGTDQRAEQRFLEDSGTFKPNLIGLGFGAVRGRWGFLFEGEALDSDLNVSLPDGRPGMVEYEAQRVGLGLLYEWRRSLFEGSDLYVTPWLGVRYRHVDLRLLDEGEGEAGDEDVAILASEESHWFEPLAGLRAQWFVTPKWSVSALADVDGFLNDQLAWGAAGWIKHHVSNEFSIGVGYRHDAFDLRGGSGDSEWSADGTAQGFVVALELDFYATPSANGGSWGHLPGITPPERREVDEAIPAGMTADDLTGSSEPDGSKPEGWLGRTLDRGHEYANEKLNAGVEAVDTWMLDNTLSPLPREKSRFFVSMDMKYVEEAEQGSAWDIRPSVDAKLDLPNMENRLKLVLSTSSVDEKPGTDPFDREEGARMGLESEGLLLKRTKLRAGVRSSLDGYAALSWKPEWRRRGWKVTPEARAFYRTDKGEGLVGSFGLGYVITDRYVAGYLPSVEYSKDTDWQVEWLQTLSFAYIFEGGLEDRHRALSTSLSVTGAWEEGTKSYRWTPIRYRAPLYRKWLYWELGPEIRWRDEDDWEPEPTIRFALSALFWGTSER